MTYKPKVVTVYAPASIGNVGPGYDMLGAAIDQPGDIVTATRLKDPIITFDMADDSVDLPCGRKNIVSHVAHLMHDELKLPFGISLMLDKQMPIGSGLGSSGASAAAAVYAVNLLLQKPLSRLDLIPFAMEGERLATGAAHADNVAPSLLGGICLIRCHDPLDIIQVAYKRSFYWTVVHPDLVVHTKAARQLIPKSLPIATVIKQMANVSALVSGLMNGDSVQIANAMHDYIAEPVRSKLIAGYEHCRQAALHAGAIAFSISGSGPSVFAISTTNTTAKKVGQAVSHAFQRYANVTSTVYVSKINDKGVTRISGVRK